jgi:hypothetical protein
MRKNIRIKEHKQHIKWVVQLLFIGFTFIYAQAQTAINVTGSPAHPSAALDISSTEKGILVPRMTAAQRVAISNPAEGLLVFQVDQNSGFYVCKNNSWSSINKSSGSVPPGSIIDWWRPNVTFPIPKGYKICDGTTINDVNSPINGQNTPDMTNRFAVGTSDPGQAGVLGGTSVHTHNISDSGVTSTDFLHRHIFNYGTIFTNYAGSHNHTLIPSSGTLSSVNGHSHTWASFNDDSKAWNSYNSAGVQEEIIDWGNGMDSDGSGHYPIQTESLFNSSFGTSFLTETHNHTYSVPFGKFTSSEDTHRHSSFVGQSATNFTGDHNHPYTFGPVASNAQSNNPKNTGLLKLMRIY